MAQKSKAASEGTHEKKGHICPPSDATHPKDRWETAFVYSYICKFTQLKNKVDGFYTPMDLEDALMTAPGQVSNLLQDILARFILILRPQSRNVGPSQLNATLSGLLADFFRSSERSLFWDEAKKANIDPLADLPGGFWEADWDLKLKILRQLVEYQLSHSSQVRELLDRAWGVKQMQHKKKDADSFPPDQDDPHSQQNLLLEPVGQDSSKKRYWILDNSPRLYVSTNPWKVTSSFKSAASCREEYIEEIQALKANAPPLPPEGARRSKFENAHLNLIETLEKRIELIDAELARIERARKKVEQRNLLLAQAEVRGPRTRRQLRRPEYVYNDLGSDDDDQDEYNYEEEAYQEDDRQEDEDEVDVDGWQGASSSRRSSRRMPARNGDAGLRRSSRQTNGKPIYEEEFSEWKGERRSRRLGANMDLDDASDRPRKRSRTVDSSEAGSIGGFALPNGSSNPSKKDGKELNATGAAALKSNEVAVETVKGKKKNKFWFYAVEPVAGAGAAPSLAEEAVDSPGSEEPLPGFNGKTARRIIESTEPSESRGNSEIPSVYGQGSSAPMSLDSEGE